MWLIVQINSDFWWVAEHLCTLLFPLQNTSMTTIELQSLLTIYWRILRSSKESTKDSVFVIHYYYKNISAKGVRYSNFIYVGNLMESIWISYFRDFRWYYLPIWRTINRLISWQMRITKWSLSLAALKLCCYSWFSGNSFLVVVCASNMNGTEERTLLDGAAIINLTN